MNTPHNQLHMETERKLRDALLFCMERDEEPSVGRLCGLAQVSRSTFYRHCADVYDLMERVEGEFQHGLYRSLEDGGGFLARLGSGPEALEPLIAYIGRNAHFYRVYLEKHDGFPLEEGFRQYWEEQVKPMFRACGVEKESHMRYYYGFFRAGLLKVLQTWLADGCAEPPGELAELISRMLPTRP